MKTTMEFEVDVMLRINLRVLIDPDEEIDTASKDFPLQSQKCKKAYGFPRYYRRKITELKFETVSIHPFTN